MIAESLAYAARGWPVFPCKPHDKTPATPNGFKAATTDADRIRQWWTRWPDCNVGIATGEPSGLVVLDLDPRHGGDDTLAALLARHGPLPPGPVAITGGGGRHLLFAHPGGHVTSRANALGPGIDVRADGGYIIAPPSRHPHGGLYRWQTAPNGVNSPTPTWRHAGVTPTTGRDLPALPDWCLSLLRNDAQHGATPRNDAQRDVTVSRDDEHSCIAESLCLCGSVSLTLCGSVSELDWIGKAIALSVPTVAGERNRAIFNFARLLKAHPELANADAAALAPHVAAWHKAAEPHTSGEHHPDDTRADFAHAWARVKYAAGSGPVAEALARADQTDPPACAESYSPVTRRLLAWCRELQRIAGDGPFYLAGRVAAELLGIDRDRAAKLLGLLCADGVLELVHKGHTGRASEYRYRGD